MKNFEFEHEGKKLWYSRSLACGLVILRYDSAYNTIEVLAARRGQGCEYNKGKWNIPGGFIDFDEDSKQCAIREAFEETGVSIPVEHVNFQFLDTTPRGKRQTMVAMHSAIFPKTATKDWELSMDHVAEKDEVAEVKWIDLKDLDKYDWSDKQIANIKQVTHNCSWVLDIVGFENYSAFY
jgi:8-oxo-dGTP diphosphatase